MDSLKSMSGLRLVHTRMHAQERPCESMHAGRSVWITHECEPSLWMLLIAQRAWFSGPVRDEVLREVLKQLYAVCTLLHGPLQCLLDQVCLAITLLAQCSA